MGYSLSTEESTVIVMIRKAQIKYAPQGFFYLVDGCVSIALDDTGAYCILFY